MDKIRNIAIIAHVDHGKTTLVDQLLKQAGTFRANQKTEERMMDSMDLEKEKGITIRAKNAAFRWNDYHVNIVDTPGHADFGGEVERIMKMVDGVLLVVDSHDGPQAQTKFVLRKAMENGLKPIVVINKIDRENARPHKVLDMVFELFLELNATDEQLDFPHIYASAKAGYAKRELVDPSETMTPLYEAIAWHIPAPKKSDSRLFPDARVEPRLQRLPRPYRLRTHHQRQREGRPEHRLHSQRWPQGARATSPRSSATKASKRCRSRKRSRATSSASPASRKFSSARPSSDSEEREALPFVDIDPPTITMKICVNDSPLAGREGKLLTARQIKDRLIRETRTNVSIIVTDTEIAGHFDIKAARGNADRHSRRADAPRRLRNPGLPSGGHFPAATKPASLLEPMETLYVDVPPDNLGDILQSLAGRKAEIVNMEHNPHSVLVEATIPTRGLIGFETDLVNVTKGHGIALAPLQGIRPVQGRNPQPQQRRAHLHGRRHQHRLRLGSASRTAAASSSGHRKKSTKA